MALYELTVFIVHVCLILFVIITRQKGIIELNKTKGRVTGLVSLGSLLLSSTGVRVAK